MKICVITCDMNSTLGSVVPLAMFYFNSDSGTLDLICQDLFDWNRQTQSIRLNHLAFMFFDPKYPLDKSCLYSPNSDENKSKPFFWPHYRFRDASSWSNTWPRDCYFQQDPPEVNKLRPSVRQFVLLPKGLEDTNQVFSISQCVTKRPTFVILFSFHFRFVLILIKTSRDGEQRSFAYFSSDWKYRWLIKDDGLIFLAGIRSDVWEGRMMKMSMTQGSKGTTPISLLLDMAALSQVGCVSSESEKLILKYTTNSIKQSRSYILE